MLAGLFDHIFIINLPSRPDRLRELEAQLRVIGCSLQHPSVQVFPAVRPDSQGTFPSIGARGCFLSHLGVIKTAAERKYRRILILEDDCNFVNVPPEHLESLASELGRRDWAFFYGGALNTVQVEPSDDRSLAELA
ncbi:MAG: glycosyltransferase family 25 protein, partial [Alcaligenaceae bacterium]